MTLHDFIFGVDGVDWAVAPAVAAAAIEAAGNVLSSIFGGGKDKKSKPSQLFQTLAQIRAQRLASQKDAAALQSANQQQPGEVESAVEAVKRKLETARQRAGGAH